VHHIHIACAPTIYLYHRPESLGGVSTGASSGRHPPPTPDRPRHCQYEFSLVCVVVTVYTRLFSRTGTRSSMDSITPG
jgi:hypothetical protein